MAKDLQYERTVVLIKPDGVKRGLVGEILVRFEKMGLKIRAMKMVWADEGLAKKHYPDSRTELLKGIGEKTLATYEKYGMDPNEKFGKMTPEEIGKMVNGWNIEFLTSGPVVAMLLEGLHSVDNVRAMVGSTMPVSAQAGTIRGDYSLDSAALANIKGRAVKNLIHASGNNEEADYEAQLWFKEVDVVDNYKRTDEDVMFEK
jgi:nucleoside-diphosphate kinase